MARVKSYLGIAASGVSRYSWEKDDCTVRALANCANIPYDEAHDCLRSYGRKNCEGTKASVFHGAYLKYDIEPIAFFGSTKDATYLKYTFPNVRKLEGCTVKRLMEYLSNKEGCFIVGTIGHVFAVVDGLIIDHGKYMLGGQSVTCLFQKKM